MDRLPNVKIMTETPTQAVTGAAAIQTVTDARGRVLSLRKIGPLQRTRLFKIMGPDNSRNVPLLGTYMMAVSVSAIDDTPEPFPTSDAQIEALISRLDDDGLSGVAEGWKKNGWVTTDEEGNPDTIQN